MCDSFYFFQDPYFLDCLPVHLACAVELNMKNDLFLLGHKLVEGESPIPNNSLLPTKSPSQSH